MVAHDTMGWVSPVCQGDVGPTAWAGQVSQGGCFLWLLTSPCILKPRAQTGMGPGYGAFLCSATQTEIRCLLQGHRQQVKASRIWQSPRQGLPMVSQGGCPIVLLPFTATGPDRDDTRPWHTPIPSLHSHSAGDFCRFWQGLCPKGKNVHRASVCTAPCSHRQLEAPHSHRQGGTSLWSTQKCVFVAFGEAALWRRRQCWVNGWTPWS